jgi:hypothetical protein
MKKKKDNRQTPGEEMFRGPRKPVEKAPKNPKRKIFEELEEEEDIDHLFHQHPEEDFFDDQVEEEDDIR